MFVITYEERKLVEDELHRNIQQNPLYGIATYKLIYNLLNRIRHTDLLDGYINELTHRSSLQNLSQEELNHSLSQLLQVAFEYATEADKPLVYTTGQLANYFGVSTTTINNWLREKRLAYPGMDNKQSFKQARIPDSAIYTSTNGKETILREVIQEYEYQKAQEPVYTEVDRMKNLVQTVLSFEALYGGKYEEVLARLGDPQSSNDWKWARDADEWRYVIREITRER
ncbi:hypothetical protein [Cohnella soli]|uniref:DNA-binding protein n=1 Tax=Cohnella soli TaxID=425005 RepID=A0ABW0HJP7_9BACL